MERTISESPVYGLVAEFETHEELLHAARRARSAGYRRMDAFSPFPVHGLVEALGFQDNRVPWIIFWSGVAGGIGGFLLQCWVSMVAYPHNVGGRPLLSWPQFVPVTFECTVLLAAFGAVIGMLALNGLPKPYHPIFNAPNFDRASQDSFFLCIEAADPQFDRVETARFLDSLRPKAVSEVEP